MKNKNYRKYKVEYVMFILAIGISLAFTGRCGAREFTSIWLKERVLLLQQGPWQETMTVLDAGSALVIVDTWSSPVDAANAKRFIAKQFNKPVRYVINTHHHFDHTFGNQVFKEATIIGHRFCAEDMKTEYGDEARRLNYFKESIAKEKNAAIKAFYQEIQKDSADGFQLTPPAHLVDDRETFHVGDLTIKLYHAPGLHTRSYLVLYIPELGLIFTRKEFHHDYRPILEPGADLPKLIHCLEDILAQGKPVKYIIWGHFNPLPDPDLQVARDYLASLL